MSQGNIFQPVDLREEDPDKLTEQLDEFISRIRENHEIGVEEAKALSEDVDWILDNYSQVIGFDKEKTLRNGSQNIILALDSTKAILLLQVIRETIKPLTETTVTGERE